MKTVNTLPHMPDTCLVLVSDGYVFDGFLLLRTTHECPCELFTGSCWCILL